MTEEQQVERALRDFYDAIEDMISGRGLDTISATWHHTDQVTSKHPMSDWATGWDEVWATWGIAATFGRPDRGGSQLVSTRVHTYGDIAYATSVFQASTTWGGERLLCTNVLQRLGGAWKIIHHHADPGPGMAAALERMIAEETSGKG